MEIYKNGNFFLLRILGRLVKKLLSAGRQGVESFIRMLTAQFE